MPRPCDLVRPQALASDLAHVTKTRQFAGNPLAGREEMVRATFGFTRRELQVVVAIHDGLAIARIAERLGITEPTVRAHLRSVYSKLGVSSQAAMVLHLFSLCMCTPAPCSACDERSRFVPDVPNGPSSPEGAAPASFIPKP